MTYEQLVELAGAARPLDDDDWGSERQLDAENAFFAAAGDLGEDFNGWALKATTEELLDEALRILKAREGKMLSQHQA